MTALEFRALDDVEWRINDGEDGTFEGVACRYNVLDSYGTTFHPGAFKSSSGNRYALLFMHDPHQPIGTFRAEERDNHLWISGQYDNTAAGRDARIRAQSGSARELSVGFVRTDLPHWKKLAEMPEAEVKEKLRNIRGARLVETSQITARMAAVPGSKLKTVRAALGALWADDDDQGDDLETLIAGERARLAGASSEQQRARAAARLRLAGAVVR